MKSALRRRISPSVPFTLTFKDETGDVSQSYRLAYNFVSMSLIEERLSTPGHPVSMLTDAGEVFDMFTVKATAVVLWAALQEYQPEYEGQDGLEVVAQNLTVATAMGARNACFEAYISQLPEDQQEKVRKAREAGPTTEAPLVQSQPPTE